MPGLPQNNTARVWVDYFDGINNHSLMMRFDEATVTAAEAITALHGFLVAATPLLYLINIEGARASDQGSNVSFPVTWTGDGDYGDGALTPALAPRELRFLGRAVNGIKASWSLYGGKFTTPDNYRLNANSNALVEDVLDYLTTLDADGVFLTVSGHKPIRYQYASVNFNSYWEAQARV